MNFPIAERHCRLNPAFRRWMVEVIMASAVVCNAADVDLGRLPPPANIAVDFDRDVRPIFEQSCFRCHGPERPKSGFRLDNREAALKGGANNSDNIVPGESERSRLIHYVAQLDEEMLMPPPEISDPLSAEQVGLLRAWIDQGASWGMSAVFPESTATGTFRFGWMAVHGDQGKFRELTNLREGFGGGLEHFQIVQRVAADQKISAEGHFLFPEQDFRLKLGWENADLGFVRAGFEMWRRYYDDTGAFYRPFSQPQFDLHRELHLDIGRAWIDFGLALPDLPRIVVGYEFQFRDGVKSALEWGNVNGKNIYPAAKAVHEQVHIVKLDVAHEVNGWSIEDNARIEFYRNTTRDEQITTYSSGPQPDAFVRTRERLTHVQGANTLRVERQFTDWWFGSGGYLYSWMEGDSALNQSTVDAQDAPTFGFHWNNQITLRREMHVMSVASLFMPVNGLSISLGAQGQFSRQEGFGDISLDLGDPTIPELFFVRPGKVRSDLDQTRFSENVGLRFSRIPFTVLFAEARLEQDVIGQFERETGSAPDVFLRDTDYQNNRKEFRTGFNTSPWRHISLTAHYNHRDSDSDYDHRRDESATEGVGYSAFIRHREIRSDEFESKLTFHPAHWLKTTFTYRHTDTDYFATTDPLDDPFYGIVSPGGRNLAGTYRADHFGFGASVSPSPRLYFSGAFFYTESRTLTGSGEVPAVVPYRAETCSAIASASYAVNSRTSLLCSYAFSRSSYAQDNLNGLPAGIDHAQHRLTAGLTRKLTKHFTTGLRYSFFEYRESNSRGFNDFVGHGIFATVTATWP
jgi:hypothetical protein